MGELRPARFVGAGRPLEQELDLGDLDAVVVEDADRVRVGETGIPFGSPVVGEEPDPGETRAGRGGHALREGEPRRRHRWRPREGEMARDQIVCTEHRGSLTRPPIRRLRLGDGGDEALELAQVATLVDAVAVDGVVGDDRVAGVPVPTRLRVEPVDVAGSLA